MTIETERLRLRPWVLSDADDLFRWASDSAVGPAAGWPAHGSVDESRAIIQNVLSGPEDYAICLKPDGRPVGAISLMPKGRARLTDRDGECELGYWIGRPFWGRGLVPEAARALLRRAFSDLGMSKVWCAWYEGNDRSRRVQQKLGFQFQYTQADADVPLLHEKRPCHVNLLTRAQFELP